MTDVPAEPTKSFTFVNGKKVFYGVDLPPIWSGPVCDECGADLGSIGFHGDGCSQNGPYRPFDTEALRALFKGGRHANL